MSELKLRPPEKRRTGGARERNSRSVKIPFMKDKVRVLAFSAGHRRPLVEITDGEDLSRKIHKWVHVRRVVNRGMDWYSETIIEPESGEIIHECYEPLSKHTGHGTAKLPLPPIDDFTRKLIDLWKSCNGQ
jgi:hypothetical protein